VIENNSIVGNASSDYTVYCQPFSGTVAIDSNTISQNTASATSSATIFVPSGSGGLPGLTGNNLLDNATSHEFRNETSRGMTIDAAANWWGSAVVGDIEAAIYDFNDDPTRDVVEFNPFLVAANPDAPVPPPTGVVASWSGTTLTVQWNAVAVSDLAGYRVYFDSDAGFPFGNVVDAGNATNAALPGLDPTQVYRIGVTAYDSDADGADDWTDGNESWFAVNTQNAITGTKFHDLNADGNWDGGEPGLSGWTVFADLNGNGERDSGEPSDVTDGAGEPSPSHNIRPSADEVGGRAGRWVSANVLAFSHGSADAGSAVS